MRNSYCTGERSKDIEEEKKTGSSVAITAIKVGYPASENENTDSQVEEQVEEEREPELLSSKKEKECQASLKSEARRMKKREKKKKKKSQKKAKGVKESAHESSSSGTDEENEKKKRLLEALKVEEKRIKQVELLMGLDERKRPYNSMVESKAPNEEELEAYYIKRKRDEDPMAYF